MDISNINNIIFKKISGEASSEELALLDDWMKDSIHNVNYVTYVSNLDAFLKKNGQNAPHNSNADEQWIRLEQKITHPTKVVRLTYLKYAAAVLLLGALFYLFFRSGSSDIKQTQHIAQVPKAVEKKQAPKKKQDKSIKQQNFFYQTADFTNQFFLPDSSKVFLDKNSQIRYQNAKNLRALKLEGEAIFDVVHLDKKVFSLETKDLNIQVVGTIFGVNENDERVEIFVNRGKIVVQSKLDAKNRIEIKEGEFYTYNLKRDKFHKKRSMIFKRKVQKIMLKIKNFIKR